MSSDSIVRFLDELSENLDMIYTLIPQSGLLKKNSKPLIKKPLQGLAYVCDFT